MKLSRRDLLKFAAGSAAGIMFTPLPWKTLDDTAIWTQNWPWIPTPPKGESTTRFTTCALCPAACGLRARCVAGQPVSLSGVAEHPLSWGTLCPIGFGAHHLAYHPGRVVQPLRRTQKFGTAESRPITPEEAAGIIAAAIGSAPPGESVAVLDQQPGRIVSLQYRRLCALISNGVYLRAPMVEDATLAACASMLGLPGASVGFDLENARTIVSFGAPLFDGWGTPGRMMRLAEGRRKTGRPAVLQIETRQSRTALQADSWVPVKPGTEGTLALGLAHVLVSERLSDAKRLRAIAPDFQRTDSTSFTEALAPFTPDEVSPATGVSADRIRAIARTMAAESPTLVLGAGDPAGGPLRPEENFAIASLNFLLGSAGSRGGIVARRESNDLRGGEPALPPARHIQDMPDRSIRVLILDGAESGNALPWALIERKLADEKALVVSFSPYSAGLSRHAEIIVPSPASLESLQDVPTPFHSPVETFSLSVPLWTPPQGPEEPVEMVRKIAAALGVAMEIRESADQLKARALAIHSAGKGSIFTPSDKRTTPVKDLDSPEKLWTALSEGGCWTGDPSAPAPPSHLSFFGQDGITAERLRSVLRQPVRLSAGRTSLALMPFGLRGAAGSGQLSPLMSKVYQESGLRSLSCQALVNPATGKSLGMTENEATTVETPAGSLRVLVHFDPSVMPDVLHVAVGPDAAAIGSQGPGDESMVFSACLAEDGRSWRVADARMNKRTV